MSISSLLTVIFSVVVVYVCILFVEQHCDLNTVCNGWRKRISECQQWQCVLR